MADVSKFSTYMMVKIIPAVSKLSVYTIIDKTRIQKSFDFDYVVHDGTGPIDIDTVFDFDYRINRDLSTLFDFDFRIVRALVKNFGFSYQIKRDIQKTYTFDYGIVGIPPIERTFTFNYKIINSNLVIDFNFNYRINRDISRDYDFDYAIVEDNEIVQYYDFDYSFEGAPGLEKSFDFDYMLRRITKDFYFTYMLNASRPIYANFNFDYGYSTGGALGGRNNDYDLLLIPEVPIIERWEWSTAIARTEDGSEQRQSLRQHPRQSLRLTYLMLNDHDRRVRIEELMLNLRSMMKVPQYQLGIYTAGDMIAGNTTIFCDTSTTDIRVGDFVYYMTADSAQGGISRATSVGMGSVTISPGLDFDLPDHSFIMPAFRMAITDGSGLSMRSIAGQSELVLTADEVRAIMRPGVSGGAVPQLNGYPLLQLRSYADDDVTEQYAANMHVLSDAVDVQPTRLTSWKLAAMTGIRFFRTLRIADFDYWREFAAMIVGSRTPFYLPTYRADIVPVLGASGPSFIAEELTPYVAFVSNSYRYVQFEKDGLTSIHRIVNVSQNGANSAITLASGDVAGVDKISYVNLVRIDGDAIEFEHHQQYSNIRFTIRTVYE